MKTRTPTSKSFDCIAFKRQAQSEIYEQIKDMTAEQEIAYFRKAAQTGPFGRLWRKLQTAKPRHHPQ